MIPKWKVFPSKFKERIDPIWKAVFEEDGLKDKVEKLFEEDLDLKDKVQALETVANSFEERFNEIQKENTQLRRELQIFKGIAQCQQDQITVAKEDIIQLTARSMAKNITISGLKEEKNENCKEIVAQFLHEVLKAPIDDNCVIRAVHRMGIYNFQSDTPHMMVVKCTNALKVIILESFKEY